MKYVEEYFCKHHAHKYAPQIFYFSILKEDNEDRSRGERVEGQDRTAFTKPH